MVDPTTTSPRVRKIVHPSASDDALCAYHIANAFSQSDLQKLDELRCRVPLDHSRPTCPRRFVTEKQRHDRDEYYQQQHQEDGWIESLINTAVASWILDHSFACLPWYRFLEYKSGGKMDTHTDGSNLHPKTKGRSVATMLVYLSTCKSGGATTLYEMAPKSGGSSNKKKNKKEHEQAASSRVIESIAPVYNTVLIFPHVWPHSGDLVQDDPKIALRVDLTVKDG